MCASPSHSDYLSAFRQRSATCAAMLELSQAQAESVRKDDYTELLSLLDQKQGLLDDVARAAVEQAEVWQSWADQRDRFTADERLQCERELVRIEELLAQLLREEQAGTDLLSERRRATQRELASLNRGVRVREAYGDAGGSPRHFSIDL